MRLVNTTSVYPEERDPFACLKSLARFGFDSLDMAFDYYCDNPENGMRTDGWEDRLLRLRELSEKLSLPFTHAHAPYDAGDLCDPERAHLIRRTVRGAAILGAKTIVLHPRFRYADGRDIEEPEDFIRINKEAILPLLDTAEREGVTVLSENLLWGASKDPLTVAALVREVGCESFGWCYDTGHAHLFGFRPSLLCGAAAVPLSLHLQDNRGARDEHLIPGDGTVDWEEVFRTLHAVGYTGDFVLEAHHQSLDAKDEAERDRVLSRLCATGRKMMNLYFP